MKKNTLFGVFIIVFVFMLTACGNTFSSISDSKDIFALESGDYITFGRYEQDNNLENGLEPIEWIVLGIENNRALIISRYCLDWKPYEESDSNPYWETCSVRKWLNEDFFDCAFSQTEQKNIYLSKVNNRANEIMSYTLPPGEDGAWRGGGSTELGGGNDTEDHVFLLSWEEMPWDKDLTAKPTPFTCSQADDDISPEMGCRWWLRSDIHDSTGYYYREVSIIQEDGIKSLPTSSTQICDLPCGVRPVMWVDIRAGNDLSMKVYMLIALTLAFLFCIYFGKRYVSWLEKKNIRQPLKDEVAKVYEQDNTSGSV